MHLPTLAQIASRAIPSLALTLVVVGLFTLSQPADAQRWFRPFARAAAVSTGAVTYSCEGGVCRPVATTPVATTPVATSCEGGVCRPVVSRPTVFSRPVVYSSPRSVSYSIPTVYRSSFSSTGGYTGYSSYPVSSYSNVRYSFSNASTGGSGVYAPATVYQAPVADCPCGPNCPCRTQSSVSVTPSSATPKAAYEGFTDGSYTKTIVDALQRDPYWIPAQDAEPGLKAAFALLESALPHILRGALSTVGSLPEDDKLPATGAAEVDSDNDVFSPPTSSGSSVGPTNRAIQKALQWNAPSLTDAPRLASL